MNSPISSLTLETIARTIDEFSFIFTGLPLRLPPSVKQQHYRTMNDNHHLPTDLSNVYPSLSPQRDYFFQSFERKDKPPPLPPQHHHLREGRPEAAESATPPHIHYNSDRCAISAESCRSSSESGTPSSSPTDTESESESESEGYLPPPYTDIPTPAELEMMNHHHHAHQPTSKKRYQLPKDYTKLPHFHPPRFSRRLRNLVAERRRPMRLHLVPVVRKPVHDEEKGKVAESYWVITSPDAEAGQVKPRRSWTAMNKRILLLVIFAALLGGVIMLVLAMTLGWTR
ncbi:hypothetical protein L873DRAFT_1472591 [Choiromyces venosus 120613-1]|uniref:Uncharacterized protein n=1 Tax=Choiromyces venosus 120613-1 TaxID=1336337 RepID=A0A3N4J7H1_9PEZI|nr:hypothetical protein L873DRAFT_1472591 [Choiromyces venosus 120613-1]